MGSKIICDDALTTRGLIVAVSNEKFSIIDMREEKLSPIYKSNSEDLSSKGKLLGACASGINLYLRFAGCRNMLSLEKLANEGVKLLEIDSPTLSDEVQCSLRPGSIQGSFEELSISDRAITVTKFRDGREEDKKTYKTELEGTGKVYSWDHEKNLLLGGGEGRTLIVKSIGNGQDRFVHDGHKADILAACEAPGGQGPFFSLDKDNQLHMWTFP